MHSSSYRAMRCFSEMLPKAPLKIGDVGSYDVNGTYAALFKSVSEWSYAGMDMCAGPNVDIVLPAGMPWSCVQNDSFDVTISGQTMEHVERPWTFMSELERITRPGGVVCVIVPYAWPYHTHPLDCYRFYPDGLRALMIWARLLPVEVFMRVSSDRSDGSGDTIGIARKEGHESWHLSSPDLKKRIEGDPPVPGVPAGA